MSAPLTIIIPTVCTVARRESLMRAIVSALASAPEGAVEVLVVANGAGVVPGVLEEVHRQKSVRVIQRAEGSAPLAHLAGRRIVRSHYFAFLDDDDELLPGSSESRLALLAERPDVDFCITNGWRVQAGRRERRHPSLAGVESQPLRSLLANNWLASSAAVFRSATVGIEFFEDPQPYAEWTWLAYRLLLAGKQVAAIDEPGYVIHDTPGSLSKSRAYHRGYIELFDRMLVCDPPVHAKETLLRKRCAALHYLADQALADGLSADSWRYHLQSLRPFRHGFPYLLFTRKLIWPSTPSQTNKRNAR